MGFPRGELASPQASLSAPHPSSLLVLLALFVSPSFSHAPLFPAGGWLKALIRPLFR